MADRPEAVMAIIAVSIVVDDAHRNQLDDVSQRLTTAGMKVEQKLQSLGTLTGSVDEQSIDHLSSIAGVKAVLINIFGGILRCDTLATGVVSAARELEIKIPIVVRMEGTNVELGQKILKESGFNFTVADGMKDAAEKVVRLAR